MTRNNNKLILKPLRPFLKDRKSKKNPQLIRVYCSHKKETGGFLKNKILINGGDSYIGVTNI